MLAGSQTKQANLPIAGKTYTGLVTKLLDNFGFIDDSIFFPLTAIKGLNVKLGDKVYYECTYKKNLPFNWNATVVQLAPPNAPLNQAGGGGGGGASGGSVSSGGGGGSANQGGGGVPPPQQQQQQQYQQQSNPGGYQQQPQQYPPHQQQQQHPNNNQPGGAPNSFYQQQQQQQRPQFQSTYDPRVGPQQQQGYGGHHQQPPGPPPQQPQQPSYGQISYTSTPGSAFISTPQPFQGQSNNNGNNNNQGGPPSQQQQSGGGRDPRAPSGRWDHPAPPPPPPPPQQQRGGGNEDRFGGGDPRGPPPPGRPHAYDGRGPGPFEGLQGNRFDGPPPHHHRGFEGGRFDGPPRGFDGVGNNRFDQGGPPNRFEGPGGGGGGRFDSRFDGPQHGGGRFDQGGPPPHGRFDGPPHDAHRFDGAPPPQHQMSRFEMERSGVFGVPPPGSNIPPQQKQQQQQRPQFDRGLPQNETIGPPPQQPPQYRPGVGATGPAGAKPVPPQSSGRGMVDEFGRDIPPGGNRADNFRASSRDKDDHGSKASGDRGNRGRDRGRNNQQNNRSNNRDHRETSTASNSSSTNANSNQRDSNNANSSNRGGGGGSKQRKRSTSPASVSSASRKDRGASFERGGGGSSSSQARSRLRAYDPTNLPTSSLIRNRFTASELRNRIHGNVHIPSDLKEVLYNVDNGAAELDLRDIPKPLFYRVTNVPRTSSSTSKTSSTAAEKDKTDKFKVDKEKEKVQTEKEAKTPKTTEEEKEKESALGNKSSEEEGTKISNVEASVEGLKAEGEKASEDPATLSQTTTISSEGSLVVTVDVEDVQIKKEESEENLLVTKEAAEKTVGDSKEGVGDPAPASLTPSSTEVQVSSESDGVGTSTSTPPVVTTKIEVEAAIEEVMSSGVVEVNSTSTPSAAVETTEDNMEVDQEPTEDNDNNEDHEGMEEDMEASSVILDTPIEVDVPLDEVKKSTTTSSGTLAGGLKSNSTGAAHHHRYNVKVVLLSTPTIAEMAEKIFGSEFDHTSSSGFGRQQNSGGKSLHLHKQLAALVYRNPESGYSLLGGKWIPEKDGFMPGKGDENPNLIAAAIRLVYEQTGLNLSSCRQWKVFATFVYNRDSNFDPRAASYEITKVYMPDVWTATEGIYAPLGGAAEKSEGFSEASKEDGNTLTMTTESSKISSSEVLKKATPAVETPSASAAEACDQQHISKNNTSTVSASSNASEEEAKASTEEEVDSDGPHFTREYLEQEVLEKVDRCTVADLLKLLQGQLQVVVPKNNKSKHPRKEILISMVRERVAELIAKLKSNGGNTVSKTSKTSEEETPIKTTVETSMVENGGCNEEKLVSNGKKEDASETEKTSTNKRKLEEEPAVEKTTTEEASSEKKQKISSEEVEKVEKEVVKKIPEESSSKNSHSGVTSSLKVKGVGLSVVSLAALLTPHKHDQFELCVVAELLGDALAIHFARYIQSAVLANFHLITSGKTKSAEPTEKRSIEVNYVHLAFSYFDRAHCGLMPCEDLQALLNATGLPLSRKVYNALVSACESTEKAISYREFAEPQGPLVERPPVYPTVNLSGSMTSTLSTSSSSAESAETDLAGVGGPPKSGVGVPLMVERNGVQYNVDQLIRQAVEDQKVKVELSEQLLKVTAKSALLEKTISELESKQKLMSSAAAKKNDELCAVKRARDQLQTKYEGLRKSVATLNSTLTATLQKYPTGKGGGGKPQVEQEAQPAAQP